MELFLNLCWLSLLLPAYWLWRRELANASGRLGKNPLAPLVFACVVGCALVLLFPVISASDDLHAMRSEMEESERAFRHTSHGGPTLHAPAYFSHPVLQASSVLTVDFDQSGMVLTLLSPHYRISLSSAVAGRAPPLDQTTL
ncbi:MAG TPA: hypothetical protein VKR59_10495 [Terriglobales bacterium]|nr:hypothetical protein [Terriglobales bacterium]